MGPPLPHTPEAIGEGSSARLRPSPPTAGGPCRARAPHYPAGPPPLPSPPLLPILLSPASALRTTSLAKGQVGGTFPLRSLGLRGTSRAWGNHLVSTGRLTILKSPARPPLLPPSLIWLLSAKVWLRKSHPLPQPFLPRAPTDPSACGACIFFTRPSISPSSPPLTSASSQINVASSQLPHLTLGFPVI